MKRISIIILCIAMALMFAVASPLQFAAGSKQKYISELKIAYGTAERDALVKDGYTAADGNLNSGNTVAVYLCYKTTEDKDDAIYDISMMNMAGNYSFAKFEDMLKTQSEKIDGSLENIKTAVNEFVSDYNDKTHAALAAYDMLNLITVDGDKKLGELFVSGITDDELRTMLIQGNGKLVSSVYTAISLGCSVSAKTGTVVDAIKNADINAEYAPELYDACIKVIDEIKIIQSYIGYYTDAWTAAVEDSIADNLIEDESEMTDEMFANYIAAESETYSDTAEYIAIGGGICRAVSGVEYAHSGMTVYDLFTKDIDSLNEAEQFYYFAPFADAMTNGQFGMMGFVGLYNILQQSSMTDADIDEAYTKFADTVKSTGTETVSIYLGVDRTMYQGGKVALTTDASTESFANENYDWTNPESRESYETAKKVQKIAQIALVAITGWIVTGFLIGYFFYSCNMTFFEVLKSWLWIGSIAEVAADETLATTLQYMAFSGGIGVIFLIAAALVCLGAFIARMCYEKFANRNEIVSYTYTDIPDIIVDFIDDDTINSEYVYYYAVTRADGTAADLNGWDNKTNKYWNALYYSRDSRLGNPITEGFIVSDGASSPDGMTGVHDFEKGVEGIKSAVNLNTSSRAQDTGVYLYYNTYDVNTQTGSVFSSGSGIAALAGAFVLGLAIAGGAGYAVNKKKKTEENA